MINASTKNVALARIKLGHDIQEIADELVLPYMVVKEWSDNMDTNGLVAIAARTSAVADFMSDDNLSPDLEDMLKRKLQKVAIDLTDEASKCVGSGDIVYATSLEKCANAVVKLYDAFVLRGVSPTQLLPTASETNITLFQSLLKD